MNSSYGSLCNNSKFDSKSSVTKYPTLWPKHSIGKKRSSSEINLNLRPRSRLPGLEIQRKFCSVSVSLFTLLSFELLSLQLWESTLPTVSLGITQSVLLRCKNHTNRNWSLLESFFMYKNRLSTHEFQSQL